MEEIKQIIDDVATGNIPDDKLNSILLNKVQDTLHQKKIEVAQSIYNKLDVDKN